MPELEGSATERNLRAALDREAQDNRRFEYFARFAAVEGQIAVARVLREIAEGETAHAFGHLELLEEIDGPAAGAGSDDVRGHLAAAVAAEEERCERYAVFAEQARAERLPEVADWLDLVGQAKRAHLACLTRALEEFGEVAMGDDGRRR